MQGAIDQRKSRRKGQQGGVTLEAALVLLPAIMLIYGLFEFGFAFMVGIALQSAAHEAAVTATVPDGKTVKTIADAARDGLQADFARGCVSLSVSEYDGADVPAALATLGADQTAFRAANGFADAARRLTVDDAQLHQGAAKLGAITVSCKWSTPFITQFFASDGIQFRAYSIVAYES